MHSQEYAVLFFHVKNKENAVFEKDHEINLIFFDSVYAVLSAVYLIFNLNTKRYVSG